MKLSDMLKKYRTENDLSQREFSRRCGLSNSLISILEMGVNPQTGKKMEPDMRTYRRLAGGMNMDVDDLLEKVGIKKPKPRVIGTFRATDSMPGRIRGVSYGIADNKTRIIRVDDDPQTSAMLKLWKVASPKSKSATIEILRLMNEKED